MRNVDCPVCGHKARKHSRLHCTVTCPWLVCTNEGCNTTYSWEHPERFYYRDMPSAENQEAT